MQMELSTFTAVIEIDWADKKHDVCVQALGSDERQFSKIPPLARQLLTPEDPLADAPHLGIEGSPLGYSAATVARVGSSVQLGGRGDQYPHSRGAVRANRQPERQRHWQPQGRRCENVRARAGLATRCGWPHHLEYGVGRPCRQWRLFRRVRIGRWLAVRHQTLRSVGVSRLRELSDIL